MKTADETSLDAAARPPVRVLLAYDNARSCGAALGLLERISARFHEKTLFHVSTFTFGLLEQMDPFQFSTPEAEAELAVVAFDENGLPGAGLLSWLEIWARRHAGQSAALCLLPGGQAAGEAVRRLVRLLREMAARHGLSFLCDTEARQELVCEHSAAA